MFASIESNKYGHYLLVPETGEPVYYQSDYSYPPLAAMFGFEPCGECRSTDGTVDCQHKTASQMIQESIEFLDDEPSGEVESDLFR
jgi:hypothetical protein